MSELGVLAGARCLLHAERAAAVRCPACGGDFCRECVAEHAGRMLCRRCLERSRSADARGSERSLARRLGGALRVGLALLVAWSFFLTLGRVLLLLPIGESAESADGGVGEP